MVKDSVREELQTKVSAPLVKPDVTRFHLEISDVGANDAAVTAAPQKRELPRPAPPIRRETNPLAGQKTSPTLIEFQNKNSMIPDWKLQLQNTVRQRKGGVPQRTEAVSSSSQTRLVTHGANALKTDVVEDAAPELPPVHENPKIANALRRIDESRKTFLAETPVSRAAVSTSPPRNYPFNVVSRSQPLSARKTGGKLVISGPPKPALVPTFKIEKKKFDTNKLPPLVEEAKANTTGHDKIETEIETAKPTVKPSLPEISIHVTKPETGSLLFGDNDEIEDLAPISMRFNAALFDLIIGAFGSFALFSPVVLIGGNWFSISGLAAFGGVWAAVMFIYMTLAIGMYGKTLGMRMFGLELVDANENDYPTFHQAAVHSAVFLLSLPFFGAGFLPMIFNEEQRAAHDLAAGTIIVTEF
jgi:uncharacterized RDD family membrane protein YckC